MMMKINQTLISQSKRLLITVIIIQLVLVLTYAQGGCSVISCQSCSSTNPSRCVTCFTGFYLTFRANCCGASIQNCASCISNSHVCDSCTNNSYCINNSLCVTCDSILNQCATCSSNSVCLTCKSFYAVNSTTSRCQLCSDFMDYCMNCINNITCTSCVNDTYALNTTSSRCQPCYTFFTNCTNCVSELTCITCQNNTNVAYLNGRCPLCRILIPYCLNCTRFDFCTVCSQYYTVVNINNVTECASCSFLMYGCKDCSSSTACTLCIIGEIVNNGCSSVAGCTSVIQNPPYAAICESCDFPEFRLQPIKGKCACRFGFLAGKHCTLIIGCTNVIKNGGQQKCLLCNFFQHFQLRGNICVCKQYFQLNGTTCVQICGDGKLYTLPCDDGNFQDGDGCSSTCKIQKGFTCKRGTNHEKSICTFDGTMSLTVQSINNLGANRASLVFILIPKLPYLQKLNLTNMISFNSTYNCTTLQYQIKKNLLYVYIAFENNIQRSQATLTLQNDPNYIKSNYTTINFKIIESNGESLIYDPDYFDDSNQIMTTIIKILSGLTLFSFVFGTYSHKMIGIQTLHTIQLILIIQVLSQNYLPIVVQFKELSNALNIYQKYFRKDYQALSQRGYLRLGYSSDFIENMSVTAVIQLALIIIYFIVLFIEKIYIPLTKFRPKTVQNLEKLRSFLYRFMMFPIFIGTLIHFILSLMIHSNFNIKHQISSRFLSGLMCITLVISTFLIFFNEWKPVMIRQFKSQQNMGMKQGYIPLYLTNILIITIVASWALLKEKSSRAMFTLASLQFLNGLIFIIYKPYENRVDYIGLIINQVGVFLNALWIITVNYLQLSEFTEYVLGYGLIGWIGLIITWSTMRTVMQIRKNQKQRKKQIKKQKKCLIQRHESDRDQLVKAILKQNESHMKTYCLNQQFLPKSYPNYQMRQKIQQNSNNHEMFKKFKNTKSKRIQQTEQIDP